MTRAIYDAIKIHKLSDKRDAVEAITLQYGQDASDDVLDCLGQALSRLKAKKAGCRKYADAALRVALRVSK